MRVELFLLGLAGIIVGPFIYRHADSVAAAMYRGIPRRWLDASELGRPGQQRFIARLMGVFAVMWGALAIAGAFIR